MIMEETFKNKFRLVEKDLMKKEEVSIFEQLYAWKKENGGLDTYDTTFIQHAK